MSLFMLVAALFVADPVTEHQEALQLAQERGERLYAYDRVAWVGTDEAMPEIEARLSEGRGYVIHETETGHVLTFFGEEDGVPYALWRSTYRNENRVSGGLVEKDSAEAQFTQSELEVFAARQLAIDHFFSNAKDAGLFFCDNTKSPNVAVLPPTELDDSFQVYFMTPQHDLSLWPIGGHSRVTISPEGEATEMRGFTKSCISLDSGGNEDKTLVAMFVSHLLDPVPTEIHVFTALASDTDVMVMIDGSVWTVDGDTIAPSDIELPQP